MSEYSHLLAAIELNDEGQQVLQRAVKLAQRFSARLSIVHVVEYLPVDPAGDALLTTPVDLSGERAEQAQKTLDQWCTDVGLPAEAATVTIGAVASEILASAKSSGAELVIIGHHTRSGLRALFSHTDDGILSRAECDVLALNLKTS